jgi:hypothetical protein
MLWVLNILKKDNFFGITKTCELAHVFHDSEMSEYHVLNYYSNNKVVTNDKIYK